MATRSTISVEYPNGTIRTVYSHWDGYLQGVGATLVNHYSDPQLAQALVEQGDISSLGDTIESSVFYARDMGEKSTAAREYSTMAMCALEAESSMIEYAYFFSAADSKWYVTCDDYSGPVETALARDMVMTTERQDQY
jgi:hypothetical protein